MSALWVVLMLGQGGWFAREKPHPTLFAKEPLPFLLPLKPAIQDSWEVRHREAGDVRVPVRLYVFRVPVERVLRQMRLHLTKKKGWQRSSDLCGGVFYDRILHVKRVEEVNYTVVTSAGTCDVRYERYGSPKP